MFEDQPAGKVEIMSKWVPASAEESKEQKVIGKISKQPFGNETPAS
jgi:hypothetical protein